MTTQEKSDCDELWMDRDFELSPEINFTGVVVTTVNKIKFV